MISSPSVVYFCMGGSFSAITLRMLIEGGIKISAIIFPRQLSDDFGLISMPQIIPQSNNIPILNMAISETPYQIASKYSVPVFSVGKFNQKAIGEINSLHSNTLITVCFPRKITKAVLHNFKEKSINLHPSLLPKYKGPSPTFWQFKNGEKDFGVSIHNMTEKFDSGEVISQTMVPMPTGVYSSRVDEILAEQGGSLLVEYLLHGKQLFVDKNIALSSYQGKPSHADKEIKLSWGVKRAFNFVRGAQEYAPFWVINTNNLKLHILDAISFSLGEFQTDDINSPFNKYPIQFSDGVLLAKLVSA
jgi:methionyl-tRNA formyltransferase